MSEAIDTSAFRGGVRGDLLRARTSGDFADTLIVGREAFRDVFDLLHIQAEQRGHGDYTRATLNPLMLLLAASAWERQWKALAAYSSGQHSGNAPLRLVVEKSKREPMQSRIGTGATMLHALTGGRLPMSFEVTNYRYVNGRRLLRPQKLSGADFNPDRLSASPDFLNLGRCLNDHIELRNGVAHRAVGESMTSTGVRSDAASGTTINTSVARRSVVFFLQLVDQTVETMLDSPPPGVFLTAADRRKIRLPRHWLSDVGGGIGARKFAPHALWGGVDITPVPATGHSQRGTGPVDR